MRPRAWKKSFLGASVVALILSPYLFHNIQSPQNQLEQEDALSHKSAPYSPIGKETPSGYGSVTGVSQDKAATETSARSQTATIADIYTKSPTTQRDSTSLVDQVRASLSVPDYAPAITVSRIVGDCQALARVRPILDEARQSTYSAKSDLKSIIDREQRFFANCQTLSNADIVLLREKIFRAAEANHDGSGYVLSLLTRGVAQSELEADVMVRRLIRESVSGSVESLIAFIGLPESAFTDDAEKLAAKATLLRIESHRRGLEISDPISVLNFGSSYSRDSVIRAQNILSQLDATIVKVFANSKLK
jgi:hypothetical protein